MRCGLIQRFGPNGLYLLDEPEAARIHELSEDGIATVEYDSETVTLDRSFLAGPERYHRRLVADDD
jgi:predicted ATPase